MIRFKQVCTGIALLLVHIIPVAAQEYLLTSTGENMTVSIVAFMEDRIQFRQVEATDTTTYFIRKENVAAIGFGSDVFKRIKTSSFKPGQSFKSVDGTTSGPDYIYPVSGEVIKAVIDTIIGEQVHFRMAFSNDTTVYFMGMHNVAQITFKELEANPTKDEHQQLSDGQLYRKGVEDAHMYYTGYKAVATISFLTSWTFYGLIVPIVTSLVPPNDMYLGYPDKELMNKKSYAEAYKKTAHTIKAGKVWANAGYSAAVVYGGFLLLFIALYATHR